MGHHRAQPGRHRAPDPEPAWVHAVRQVAATLTGVVLAAGIFTTLYLSGALPERQWPGADPAMPPPAAQTLPRDGALVPPSSAVAPRPTTEAPSPVPAVRRPASATPRPTTEEAPPAASTMPLPERTVTPRGPSTGTYPYPPSSTTPPPPREPVDCAKEFERLVTESYPGLVYDLDDPRRLAFIRNCRFYLGGS